MFLYSGPAAISCDSATPNIYFQNKRFRPRWAQKILTTNGGIIIIINIIIVVCCGFAAQTAPHIIREPDGDTARQKAYKAGEDVTMVCVANEESNAASVHLLAHVFFLRCLKFRNGSTVASDYDNGK